MACNGDRPTSNEPSRPLSPLLRDLLLWIDAAPRTYADTMESWRTSCPRLPIWEDALDAGLVSLESGTGVPLSKTRVSLTPHGRAVLHT